jgi:sigma-B regulation protein RsbU (phosphoserine phosphatase)
MATILPDSLPEVADYELTAHLESCNEVGGDLYDLIALDDGRLLVVAGDVTGKGLGAALLVSSIVPLLRTLIETERDPLELVIRLNRHLWRTTDTIHFATLFLGILDPATGRLDYVNAGHNPPYLLDGAGELDSLPATGPPVGMLADVAFAAESVELPPGTTLVLYSDGVSEAGAGGDPEAAFYGEGRFEERLRSLVGRDAAEMAREALADVEDFLGGADPDDDVTLVLVQRRAAS